MRTVYAHRAQWDVVPLSELESATIYNAPRPLYGHRVWPGSFRHGSFYAAIWDDQPYAEDYRRRNIELDASVIEIVDNEAVQRIVEQQLADAGYSLADYAEIGMGIAEVAAERGLPWVEEETDE